MDVKKIHSTFFLFPKKRKLEHFLEEPSFHQIHIWRHLFCFVLRWKSETRGFYWSSRGGHQPCFDKLIFYLLPAPLSHLLHTYTHTPIIYIELAVLWKWLSRNIVLIMIFWERETDLQRPSHQKTRGKRIKLRLYSNSKASNTLSPPNTPTSLE